MRYIILFTSLVALTYNSLAQTVGLITQDTGSLPGYVLFAPISSTTTYLIDKCGDQVHTWASAYHPALNVYLYPDGSLLRPGSLNNAVFTSDGSGGAIEKYDWNGNVLWSFTISSDTDCQHHDIIELPNGNVLVHAWELKTPSQAIAAGRNPAYLDSVSLWSEKILEIQPEGTNGGNIVWEWHAWDHLVQDYDSTRANYGVVAQHPELLNLNYTGPAFNLANTSDWLHCNAIDYNAALDQIILNSHNLSEVWVIDHSTTTAEAASHTGGRHGKGGDFLYRWGNPATYNAGTSADQILYGDHNPHWIDSGLVGAGNIMVFNNGWERPQGNYSQVEIFAPPVDTAGNYSLVANQPYLPSSSYWIYTGTPRTSFFSRTISGAQRLSNGNTLICEGDSGTYFEIDSNLNTVWRYINPVTMSGIVSQGTVPVNNSVFRCTLYEPSYAGFAGQTLTPGSPIELNPLPSNCTMTITGIKEPANNGITLRAINPFTDELLIEANNDLLNTNVVLRDVTGRVVALFGEITLRAGSYTSLKLTSVLAPGVYLLNITSPAQNFAVKLIHQ